MVTPRLAPTVVPWLAVSAASVLAACGGDAGLVQAFGGPTMGSSYEVKFVASVPLATVRAAVEEELRAIDLAFSNWRNDSEIVAVNAHASTEPFAVSPRFAAVLAQALAIAEATDGAFDPTIQPLSEVYRAARRAGGGIGAAAVAAARERVGFRLVRVQDGKVEKSRPDVQLDLDGIVAGAAADAIAARLDAIGVRSFYLQVTGEVLCRGTKPDGETWRIGVVDPASDVFGGEVAVRSLPLLYRALCTSGDYRNAVMVDGKVVHHVFDPRTGANPTHDVVSASVIARSCAVADALGTALMVLGTDETRRLWPRLTALGAESALLLQPGADGGWHQEEIEWPRDDR